MCASTKSETEFKFRCHLIGLSGLFLWPTFLLWLRYQAPTKSSNAVPHFLYKYSLQLSVCFLLQFSEFSNSFFSLNSFFLLKNILFLVVSESDYFHFELIF